MARRKRRLDAPLEPVDDGFLRALRNLCPSGKDGIESVTISTPGRGCVTLTPETRRRLTQRLRGRRSAGDGG